MIDKQKLVDEYVEGIMLRIRKTRPAGPMTQEEEIGNRERLRKLGFQLIEDIANKESLYLRMWNGTFRPDNRCSREMFQKLTGIKLPTGVKATREFLMAYIGSAWVNQQQEKERAEREAEAKRDREQQEAYYAGLMDEIATRAKGGQNISGRELVNLARHLGIQVHPRTAGRQRMSSGSTFIALEFVRTVTHKVASVCCAMCWGCSTKTFGRKRTQATWQGSCFTQAEAVCKKGLKKPHASRSNIACAGLLSL